MLWASGRSTISHDSPICSPGGNLLAKNSFEPPSTPETLLKKRLEGQKWWHLRMHFRRRD
jgi:hypothetical protein